MDDINSESQFDLNIVPKVDGTELDTLEKRLSRIEGNGIKLKVDAESNLSNAKLNTLLKKIDSISKLNDNIEKTVKIKVDTNGVPTSLSKSINKAFNSKIDKIESSISAEPKIDIESAKKSITKLLKEYDERMQKYDDVVFPLGDTSLHKSETFQSLFSEADKEAKRVCSSILQINELLNKVGSNNELSDFFKKQAEALNFDLYDSVEEFTTYEFKKLKNAFKNEFENGKTKNGKTFEELAEGKFDYSNLNIKAVEAAKIKSDRAEHINKKTIIEQNSAEIEKLRKETFGDITSNSGADIEQIEKNTYDIFHELKAEPDIQQESDKNKQIPTNYEIVKPESSIAEEAINNNITSPLASNVESIKNDVASIAAKVNEAIPITGNSTDPNNDNSPELIESINTLANKINASDSNIVPPSQGGQKSHNNRRVAPHDSNKFSANENINSHDILSEAKTAQIAVKEYISSIKMLSDNSVGGFSDSLLSEEDTANLLARLRRLDDGLEAVITAANRKGSSLSTLEKANNDLQNITVSLSELQNNSAGANAATNYSKTFTSLDESINHTEKLIADFESESKTLGEHGIDTSDFVSEINKAKDSLQELINLREKYLSSTFNSPNEILNVSQEIANRTDTNNSILNSISDISNENSAVMTDIVNFEQDRAELESFSKEIEKLKKLINSTRNASIDFSEIEFGNGKTLKDFEAFLNNYENSIASYQSFSPMQFTDKNEFSQYAADFKANFIAPMKEYISTASVAKQNLDEVISVNKAIKNSESAINSSLSFQKRLEDAKARVAKWGDSNSKALQIPEYAQKYQKFFKDISDGTINSDQALKDFNAKWSAFNGRIISAGQNGKTFTTILGEMYKKFGGWSLVTKSMNQALNLMKDMVAQTKEVDIAMTNLKKVTTVTNKELNAYLENAGKESVGLGTSLTDYIDATSEFSRLGYSLDKAEELGKLATKYKSVAEDLDIDTASQSIISTVQAYQKLGVDADEVVDKFNYVGNNFAITSSGLGVALQKSASSLYSANNSLSESIALITSGNTVVQDVDKMGTQLKTISARIRGTTNELGEDAEEMTMTTAELRNELKGITGVDVMIDEDTFKSTYQILNEIAAVYDTLTDAQRASVGEMLGGKMGLNVVQSILENFDTARQIVSELDSGMAIGSADKELETSLDSINGKLNQLQSTWQQISTDAVDSNLVKGLLDDIISLGEGLDKLVKLLDKYKSGTTAFIAATAGQMYLKNKTGSGRAKLFALIEYARISSGGNTERAYNVIVLCVRELWQNYLTWYIMYSEFYNSRSGRTVRYRIIRRQA